MKHARGNNPQAPGGLLPRVREAVRDALTNEDELPGARPHGVLAVENLDLAIQHVEGLGLPMVDVGWRAELRQDRQLVERVFPASILAHGLEGDQHAQQPDGPTSIGVDAYGAPLGPGLSLLAATRSCYGRPVTPPRPNTALRTRRERRSAGELHGAE